MTAKRKWIVHHRDTAQQVVCSACGKSTRILTRADGQETVNLHVTHILDSKRHYHRKCNEVYYILEGAGKMELDGETVELTPGTTIYIPAGVRHRGWGDFTTIVIGTPAFEENDEYFD
jgi:mannose-6-phosphate isomerase-like protein (cupin superfamily)